MKKFYIASSLKNINTVREVSQDLVNRGFNHTYDWTLNDKASTLEELKTIGQLEKEAVKEADFVIVLLPAGKGSHIELGIALGQGKKVYLYSPNSEVYNVETTSTFYHIPEVEIFEGTLDELIKFVTYNE
ncbi:nucleoside 2-deoxyribosyltransferase [Halalkalibacillus halophilus]|uniref:nucleoside 2-deoxyribosyltransferase n=1 Tax=Halalkalibacillus halophilus TaxID=392827 RepID=UPI00040E812D|nr:nucleoside 2-deoxyribosyltransferase [Halalkalibacillus halophilus]